MAFRITPEAAADLAETLRTWAERAQGIADSPVGSCLVDQNALAILAILMDDFMNSSTLDEEMVDRFHENGGSFAYPGISFVHDDGEG